MATAQDDDIDVGGMYVVHTLAFVRRACGDEGVARLLELAGETEASLPQADGWISLERMITLADATVEVTGVADAGRYVGEEFFDSGRAQGIDQMIRAAGAPGEAIAMLVSFGSRLAGAWTLEVTDSGDRFVEITSYPATDTTNAFFCGTGIGYYSLVPTVFGMRAAATHPDCLTRGDPVCRYIIRWDDPIEEVGGGTFDPVGAFEELQGIAAELARADDPDSLVHLAAELAPNLSNGRRFVVHARFDGAAGRRTVTAHKGFASLDDVNLLIERVEAGQIATTIDEQQICVAPLHTGRADYGWCASVHPPRSTIDTLVVRPLTSYASHVASALEAAVALETARRDRDTAHTLVAFARDLAAVTDVVDVADLVEAAILGATAAVDARVWILQPDDRVLRAASNRSLADGEHLIPAECESDTPGHRTVGDADVVSALHLGGAGIAESTLVPLLARGAFLGWVAAGWSPGDAGTVDELERIEAIVDQAALAVDVAGLLADLTRQARHDPLTNLANRALLAERAELAMAQARRSGKLVGALFVDLDRFKSINDDLGHTAGDEVICEVADRLRGIARAGDTVSRIGGDEFVILLTECASVDDAMTVGHRVNEAMQPSFYVGGMHLSVSATVGVYAAAPDECTWHALLDRADAAMYRGKQQGRNAVTSA